MNEAIEKNKDLLIRPEVNLDAVYKAYPFQKEAVVALADKEYGAVFHEQGLGKTKIAVDLCLQWLEENIVDSILIVTKKGLVANWQRELKIHSHLSPTILGQNRSSNFAAFNSPIRLYLLHYEVLISEKERFKLFLRTRKIGIVLDESQKIKNPESRIAKVLFDLSNGFKRKIILTGTPVANRPYDLWSQIFFLDGGSSLGMDFKEFKKNLDIDSKLADSSKRRRQFENYLSQLFNKISDFTVRETKEGGRISLPKKEIENITCDWELVQEEMYKTVRDQMRTVVVKKGVPQQDISEDILKRLLRLIQIASNPMVFDDSYSATPGKYSVLLDLVDEIIQAEEKVIIWSTFTKNVDWLANEFGMYGCKKIHGKMAYEDRNRSVLKFLTESESKILVATPGAAKEGLTLTVANHVVFYDRGFSLDDYLQAQDRIHRISQERTCFVHNLVMKDSIDEWVDVLLGVKHLAAQLAQGDISKEEYQSVATYDFPYILKKILGINE